MPLTNISTEYLSKRIIEKIFKHAKKGESNKKLNENDEYIYKIRKNEDRFEKSDSKEIIVQKDNKINEKNISNIDSLIS